MKLNKSYRGLAVLASTGVFVASGSLLAAQTQSPTFSGGVVKIYDATLIPGIVSLFAKGPLVMKDGKRTKIYAHRDAQAASKNLISTREYFRQKYGLNSYDGKGASIQASINVNRFAYPDILGMKHNAAWASGRFLFGAGGKQLLDHFPQALDVVAHEFTHAVIENSCDLKYAGESGALNEHLADFFGAAVQFHYEKSENPFLIGETILRGKIAEKAEALRDMMNPELGLDEQPSHVSELAAGAKYEKYSINCVPGQGNDQCGVHVLSGIPNRATALLVTTIGFEDAEKIVYPVMMNRLKTDSNFNDYAAALRAECSNVSEFACQAVDSALQDVGL